MPKGRRSISGEKRKIWDEENNPPTDGMNMEQYIAYAREKGQAKLRLSSQLSGGDQDLEHLVRTIKAIISTNKEIWERCRESSLVPPSNVAEEGKKPCLSFSSASFSSIEVSTRGGQLNFKTKPTFRTKNFDLQCTIPSKLSSIISYIKDDDGFFPDYERFLETALLLHDDVLTSFLPTLKDHLEEFQVSLGKIDSWLMECASCTDFIKEVFNKDLNISKASFCDSDCEETHMFDSICRICGKDFGGHNGSDAESDSDSDICFSHRCPVSRLSKSRGRGSFLVKDGSKTLLKHLETTGIHKDSFDITKKKQRKRLSRFLKFAS